MPKGVGTRRRSVRRQALVKVPRHLKGGAHDYMRCAAGWCGFLNRCEHQATRYRATGKGCQRCGGTEVIEVLNLTLDEVNRIRSGYYETYHESDFH